MVQWREIASFFSLTRERPIQFQMHHGRLKRERKWFLIVSRFRIRLLANNTAICGLFSFDYGSSVKWSNFYALLKMSSKKYSWHCSKRFFCRRKLWTICKFVSVGNFVLQHAAKRREKLCCRPFGRWLHQIKRIDSVNVVILRVTIFGGFSARFRTKPRYVVATLYECVHFCDNEHKIGFLVNSFSFICDIILTI